MTETPRRTGHTNTTEETGTRVGGSWMTTKIGSQQKQSPEEGISEGGPIPLLRDTTISRAYPVLCYKQESFDFEAFDGLISAD